MAVSEDKASNEAFTGWRTSDMLAARQPVIATNERTAFFSSAGWVAFQMRTNRNSSLSRHFGTFEMPVQKSFLQNSCFLGNEP